MRGECPSRTPAARFGARLDDDTRKIIVHGRRIRACLKQPESAPVSVPQQVAILLALTGGLFDSIPLEKMPDAENAVLQSAAEIPENVSAAKESLKWLAMPSSGGFVLATIAVLIVVLAWILARRGHEIFPATKP